MRLLLDTHVMLWWALGNTLLKPAARALLDDPDNNSVVSVVSVWEVAIKFRSTRASAIPVDVAAFLSLVEEAGFALLPIALPHLSAVEKLATLYGDPFDRLLVATAQVDGYRLMTHDEALADYGEHVMVV